MYIKMQTANREYNGKNQFWTPSNLAITESLIDTAISCKADKDDVYTKEEVDDKYVAKTSIIDENATAADDNVYSSNAVNAKLASQPKLTSGNYLRYIYKTDTISAYSYNAKLITEAVSSVRPSFSLSSITNSGCLFILYHIEGTLDILDASDSNVETAVGKNGGAAGIISLSLYTTATYRTYELDWSVASIVKGNSSSSNVKIMFDKTFIGPNSPSPTFLMQYYSSNYTNGVLGWSIPAFTITRYVFFPVTIS